MGACVYSGDAYTGPKTTLLNSTGPHTRMSAERASKILLLFSRFCITTMRDIWIFGLLFVSGCLCF